MPPSTDCSAARSCGGCRSKVAGGLARTGAPGHRSSTMAIAPPPRSAEPDPVDVVDTCSVYPGAPTVPAVCGEGRTCAASQHRRGKPGRPSSYPFTALCLLTERDSSGSRSGSGGLRVRAGRSEPYGRARWATQSRAVHNPGTACGTARPSTLAASPVTLWTTCGKQRPSLRRSVQVRGRHRCGNALCTTIGLIACGRAGVPRRVAWPGRCLPLCHPTVIPL